MNELDFIQETGNVKWIEELAIEELNMEESGIVNFNDHIDPIYYLEDSSINFMNNLRDKFEYFLTNFNELRGNSQNEAKIKIFKISNTVNDFMLFRNSLRLIVTRKANDLISIGLLANSGEILPARIDHSENQHTIHEIKAHVGPFNTITWRFMGEIIEINSLVRHYLTEFIRKSAR